MSALKTALITGASRGIGLEVSRQLAIRGFRVFLGVRRLPAGLGIVQQWQKEGLLASAVELDVSDPDSVRAAAAQVAAETESLDVLVNNAGICEDSDCSILDVPLELVRQTLITNSIGPLLVTQGLWPLLSKSKSGRVINVSSGLGALNSMSSGYPSYRMSKAALNALTRVLAAELASRKICVNSVSPGWVRTDMGGKDASSSVEEGADSIVWLATDAPASLTGQFIADRQAIPW